MWVKVVITAVNIVLKDKNLRELLGAIIVGLLVPFILLGCVILRVGDGVSIYNRSVAAAIIGEKGDVPSSGVPEIVSIFYIGMKGKIGVVAGKFEELKTDDTFEDDTEEHSRKVLMKASFFVYLLSNEDEVTDELAESFVKPFLENESEEDIFGALDEAGFSFTEEERANIKAIWEFVVNEVGLESQGEFTGRFANPFTIDWRSKVTSEFGYRIHPISKVEKFHNGIDIGMPTGTEIHSCSDGIVISSTYSSSAGNYIVIRDSESGYTLHYMHMSVRKAQVGDVVKTGDVIGLVGNTGNSTGSHLHLGIKDVSGNWINPRDVLSTEITAH